MENKQIKYIPKLIYIIAFYSSFRNVNVYLFNFNLAPVRIIMDYLFIALNIMLFVLIVINNIIERNHYINKNTLIGIILSIWIVCHYGLSRLLSVNLFFPSILLASILTYSNLLWGIKDRVVFIKAMRLFIIGALISAMVPLIKFYEVIGSRTSNYGGLNYSGGIWNQVLISFVSSGWLILAFIQEDKSWKRIGIISFIVIWLGAFSGLSRSFFVLTVISVLTYFLASKFSRKTISFFVLLIIIFVFANEYMEDALSGILERLENTVGNLSDEIRIDIWKSYLQNIKSYIIIGTIGEQTKFAPSGIAGPHSTWLNWIVRYGLIGIIGFTSIVLSAIKEIFNIKKIDNNQFGFLMAWIVAFIIQISISETGFDDVSFYSSLAFVTIWSKVIHQGESLSKLE